VSTVTKQRSKSVAVQQQQLFVVVETDNEEKMRCFDGADNSSLIGCWFGTERRHQYCYGNSE